MIVSLDQLNTLAKSKYKNHKGTAQSKNTRTWGGY